MSPLNAKMPDLKRCFEDGRFSGVKTALGSGNVVFDLRIASAASLERTAEAAMSKRIDRSFCTIVRRVYVLNDLLGADPFAEFALPPNAKQVATFIHWGHQAKLALPPILDGVHILHMNKLEIFIAYEPNPRGLVFMTLIEKTFGTKLTTRSWDTIKRCAMA